MNEIVRLGADPFPPYQFLTKDNRVGGRDFELISGIFSSCQLEAHVTIAPWEQVEEMLKNGELDALFQVQKNPQRERQYFFSQLLRNAVTEIVSGGSHLKLESLGEIEKNPYTLGVLGGYAYSKEIDGINPKNKKFYATSWELIKALSKNEVDFAVCDRGVLEYIQRQESLENIYPLSNLEFIRPLFVMFRDFDLCARFSAAQRALK